MQGITSILGMESRSKMKFETDAQTVKDLNLFSERDECIFNCYNYTNTFGGKVLLRKQMSTPSSDFTTIDNRVRALDYLMDLTPEFEILQKDVAYVEHYLRLDKKPLQDHFIDAFKDALKNKIKATNDYYLIGKGIDAILKLYRYLRQSFLYHEASRLPSLLTGIKSKLDALSIPQEVLVIPEKKTRRRSGRFINRLDNFFRDRTILELKDFMEAIYELDVLFSLVKAMQKNEFSLPEFENVRSGTFLSIKDLYHPLVDSPVKNSIELKEDDNCCFLTGPNMSGKSTFLKSIGLCVYLAHLGFPVPAKKIRLTPFHGLITTINLSDNLNLGYSHYYGEIQRMKYVALRLEKLQRVIVIIDEMFRGTNVTDARYGTAAISAAFTKIKESKFFVSSHIVEVTGDLQESNRGIQYWHLGIGDEKDLESYAYALRKGVAHRKLGRKILEQEGILEILNRVCDRG